MRAASVNLSRGRHFSSEESSVGKRVSSAYIHVALEIRVEPDGVLRLYSDASIPAEARLAVLVFEASDAEPADLTGLSISKLAAQSGAFSFLNEEPSIRSIRNGRQRG